MKAAFACVGIVLIAGCDPTARAGDSARLGSDQRSQIGESCGTTLHCTEGARCLDMVCRASAGSTLGEFHAAAGNLAMGHGDVEAAVASYAEAVNQYEANQAVEAPAELYCAQGNALVEVRNDKTRAELAARVLHRCLLGAPVGSRLRARAMGDLAQLVEVGLDPLLLARNELADAYLTKEGRLPSGDNVKVTVKPVGRATRSRTFTNWLARLAEPAVRDALAPCWAAHFRATRTPVLTVNLEHKYTYKLDQYDDFDRSLLTLGAPATGGDPASVAHQCATAALAPIADAYSKKSGEASWRVTLAVTIAE